MSIVIGIIGALCWLVLFLNEEWLQRDNPKFGLGLLLCAAAICCFVSLIFVLN